MCLSRSKQVKIILTTVTGHGDLLSRDVKNSTLSGQSAQMAVRLSALRTSRDLLPRNIHFLRLLLLQIEYTPVPCTEWRIMQIEHLFTTKGPEPATFRLV
jgi:hypothetical protein